MYKILLTIALSAQCVATTVTIGPEPIATGSIPNSILANPPLKRIQYSGKDIRYSTCSGVAWCDDNTGLATVNFLSGSVHLFSFDKEKNTLRHLKRYDKSDGLPLDHTGSLIFSNNRKLLSITNMFKNYVSIYQWQGLDGPLKAIHRLKSIHPHGSQFTPCDNYLAIAELRRKAIRIYRIVESEGGITSKQTQIFFPRVKTYAPKDIAFTRNGKFAIIGVCNVTTSVETEPGASILSYRFDMETGKLDRKPVDRIDNLYSIEVLRFLSDSTLALSTDQINDRIYAHEFDPETGKFGKTWIALEPPRAELSFPHGMSISKDDRLLAVTNYGDDRVTIYEITKR